MGHEGINHELGFYPVNRRMEICRATSDELVDVACAMQQSPAYAKTLGHIGANIETYVARQGTQTQARFLVVRRKLGPVKIAWLPRGPVWAPATSDDIRRGVFRALSSLSETGTVWIISPDTPKDASLMRHAPLISAQHMAELDLTRTQDARLRGLHGKWRNRLRRAQSHNLTITHRPFDPDRDMQVLRQEMAQQSTRKYRGLPPEFALGWAAANPDGSRLFTVSRSSAPLAYMLVLLHPPAATYHIGWNSDEGRRLSAHNLALWEAATWLAQNGYQRFDLGTVDTEHAPGLARFKIGTGARIRPLGPTCLRLPNAPFQRRMRHDAA